MSNTDRNKPVVHSSYKALLAETDQPEPYVYTNSESQRVTFPDPGELGFEEAEQFLIDITKMTRSKEILTKWLGEEEYDKLRKDKLTLRQLNALMKLVQGHYRDIFGDEGE